MENHYEYLKLDMSATKEQIDTALAAVGNEDEARVRKIRSIMQNERFKEEYDNKLIAFLIGGSEPAKPSSGSQIADAVAKIKALDSGSLHDYYVYMAVLLLVFNFISSLLVSLQVDYVISLLVMIATIALLYKDWKLLELNNKATFSVWWILFSPVYLFKRANAKGESKRLFAVWIGIIAIFMVCNFLFSSGRAELESAACETVSDIYRTQLHRPGITCKSVAITESNGKNHVGFVELSNGSTRDVTVQEYNDGQIYVTVE